LSQSEGEVCARVVPGREVQDGIDPRRDLPQATLVDGE
jgi:hypothetical protein